VHSDWRARAAQRQQHWSRLHGFKLGRKIGDWSKNDEAPQEDEEAVLQQQEQALQAALLESIQGGMGEAAGGPDATKQVNAQGSSCTGDADRVAVALDVGRHIEAAGWGLRAGTLLSDAGHCSPLQARGCQQGVGASTGPGAAAAVTTGAHTRSVYRKPSGETMQAKTVPEGAEPAAVAHGVDVVSELAEQDVQSGASSPAPSVPGSSSAKHAVEKEAMQPSELAAATPFPVGAPVSGRGSSVAGVGFGGVTRLRAQPGSRAAPVVRVACERDRASRDMSAGIAHLRQAGEEDVATRSSEQAGGGAVLARGIVQAVNGRSAGILRTEGCIEDSPVLEASPGNVSARALEAAGVTEGPPPLSHTVAETDSLRRTAIGQKLIDLEQYACTSISRRTDAARPRSTQPISATGFPTPSTERDGVHPAASPSTACLAVTWNPEAEGHGGVELDSAVPGNGPPSAAMDKAQADSDSEGNLDYGSLIDADDSVLRHLPTSVQAAVEAHRRERHLHAEERGGAGACETQLLNVGGVAEGAAEEVRTLAKGATVKESGAAFAQRIAQQEAGGVLRCLLLRSHSRVALPFCTSFMADEYLPAPRIWFQNVLVTGGGQVGCLRSCSGHWPMRCECRCILACCSSVHAYRCRPGRVAEECDGGGQVTQTSVSEAGWPVRHALGPDVQVCLTWTSGGISCCLLAHIPDKRS
jgi:hypothetical protein